MMKNDGWLPPTFKNYKKEITKDKQTVMYTVAKNTKTISFALMAIGLIALIFGFSTDERMWAVSRVKER